MKKPFERGIYLLPNLMTTAALFAGFYAVIAGMQGYYEQGAIAIFIAMVFDGLDGRVARMTNSSSAFGAEYDSLADMVSFGLAPALLVYQWALQDFGKLGWLAAFIYTAGAALRLARFNTQVGIADKRYFQGLPSPAAAALLAGLIWMVENDGLQNDLLPILTLVLTIFAGLMMVSNIRFSSFKELNIKNKVSFVTLILGVLVLVVISIKPALILFTILFLYALSGPVVTLTSLRKTRELRRQHREQSEHNANSAEAAMDEDTTAEDNKKSDS
ncbi:CDP-diacylglycerol--serine O-phosphatidyltransferase [Thiomicrorhabdus sp. 6S2-11]|jgi:CDP-diacylglycerol--serine O-phosphatidyltransferase|uniref:CDP-diacylglycerol--serine O-phosphatidyltransferase n=1 Tax=Thiomicrorhabdus marina TaxID=2818442 RepID=A0ABS3Q646_9GAMM|nr:CDP-diacylglycerol--serine O-phosphatidyltransferase [Thiomicrorhabdus marina]MBO1927741.1 CDP-diacylglycerol--serine O-phosphatidyltransferase [Thiomicrorhabdus marina]